MGKLLDKISTQNALRLAWYRIRENGYQSSLPETREAIKDFERDVQRNIIQIQSRLRSQRFEFLPQKGILKAKKSGGYRGIVMAPITNRIVERACLDGLQDNIAFVKQVIEMPTSVGGVPDRSVPHGLALIRDAFANGKKFFIRSDISSFFDGVPRDKVLKILSSHTDDQLFLSVLNDATKVILENEKSLGEDRKVFPINYEGVAQGSPLSPLFGNILLSDFDKAFNNKGIVCVRFIDDFIILGEKEAYVRKAFEKAKKYLLDELGLKCHDPFVTTTPKDKAQYGDVADGFIFLGYDIRPGLFQPSKPSRIKLLENIDGHIKRGRTSIVDVTGTKDSSHNKQRYVQTLQLIDNVVRGWGNAFAYGNSPDTMCALDTKIDEKLENFRKWFVGFLQNKDPKTRRRAGGVCLLEDIPVKSLDELPFRLSGNGKNKGRKNVITISTDGSVIPEHPTGKKDKGNGGWAAVFHDGHTMSGHEAQTTNNRMELKAVIEAIKYTQIGASILIRTDSQYVFQAIEKSALINKNHDLWKEYYAVAAERKVKVVWIKGHSGDPHNERADQLANNAAKLA